MIKELSLIQNSFDAATDTKLPNLMQMNEDHTERTDKQESRGSNRKSIDTHFATESNLLNFNHTRSGLTRL